MLKPERRLKLRERGVASSAPAPRVLALIARAAEWNGRVSGVSFAAETGMVRINPSALDGALVDLPGAVLDKGRPVMGLASASCW